MRPTGRVGKPALLTLGGSAAVVVGSLLPWASYAGFPGLMTLSFTFSGARLYCMLLALVGLLCLSRLAGRARAVRVAAYFALAISLLTALLIGYAGSGLVNVDPGAWVAVLGAVVMA